MGWFRWAAQVRVERVFVDKAKPSVRHIRLQTEPIRPPSPIYIEIPPTGIPPSPFQSIVKGAWLAAPPTPAPSWVLPVVDLVFLVDNSGSVGLADFKLVRAFLAKFLDHLLLKSPDDGVPLSTFFPGPGEEAGWGQGKAESELSRFGVVIFNTLPKVIIPLTSEVRSSGPGKKQQRPGSGSTRRTTQSGWRGCPTRATAPAWAPPSSKPSRYSSPFAYTFPVDITGRGHELVGRK